MQESDLGYKTSLLKSFFQLLIYFIKIIVRSHCVTAANIKDTQGDTLVHTLVHRQYSPAHWISRSQNATNKTISCLLQITSSIAPSQFVLEPGMASLCKAKNGTKLFINLVVVFSHWECRAPGSSGRWISSQTWRGGWWWGWRGNDWSWFRGRNIPHPG